MDDMVDNLSEEVERLKRLESENEQMKKRLEAQEYALDKIEDALNMARLAESHVQCEVKDE